MSAPRPAQFDEMHAPDGSVRDAYTDYQRWLSEQDAGWMRRKGAEAESFFRRTGITFNVYGDDDGEERLIPFDMVPRIISGSEWRRLSRGIEQRVRALNAFMHDLYHRQEIIRSGRLPERLFRDNRAWLPEMVGFTPPGGVYTHIVGIDLVRTGPDEFLVLEDNARTPSGVSYMLENRETMMAMFPELFTRVKVQPVSDYPRLLAKSLAACAPTGARATPTVAVLTPGIYNSAYFEHAFLADQMGAELVEGSDLRVVDGRVQMRTTQGFQPIDVLYRRVDDDFLDPLTFNPDQHARRAGDHGRLPRRADHHRQRAGHRHRRRQGDLFVHARDRRVLHRREAAAAPTSRPGAAPIPTASRYVLDHLAELVVKEVHGSGGYGMLIGPAASRRELAEFRAKLAANPANYIAQPTLALSTVPVFTQAGLAPRHVDLRPFVLVSPEGIEITPGGLTRVALKKGSLVVNSSQGGGTKDSWVLDD